MTSEWRGTGWSPEEVVSMPDSILERRDQSPHAAISPDGTIWVTWERIDPPYWVEHVYAAHSLFQVGVESDAEDANGCSVTTLDSYPNPFNPIVSISYVVEERGPATLTIFDPQGRRIRTLFEGQTEPGRHEVIWNGLDSRGERVASGVYFTVLSDSKGNVSSRKLVTLK
jgi:hypothetical protein